MLNNLLSIGLVINMNNTLVKTKTKTWITTDSVKIQVITLAKAPTANQIVTKFTVISSIIKKIIKAINHSKATNSPLNNYMLTI